MNILFEIADKNLIIIGLAIVCVFIFAVVIFYVVNKNNRVVPILEHERYDNEDFLEKEKKLLTEEQKKAKEELQKVYEQMNDDLQQQGPKVIEEFEREQEESAIISYQELINKSKEKNLESTTEYIKTVQPKIETNKTEELFVESKSEDRKFKNSEIISPIFGVQTEVPKSKHHQSSTYDKIDVDYDDDTNVDFLNNLKEFRKNL